MGRSRVEYTGAQCGILCTSVARAGRCAPAHRFDPPGSSTPTYLAGRCLPRFPARSHPVAAALRVVSVVCLPLILILTPSGSGGGGGDSQRSSTYLTYLRGPIDGRAGPAAGISVAILVLGSR